MNDYITYAIGEDFVKKGEIVHGELPIKNVLIVAIHKKDEIIADNVIANPDVKVEVEDDIYGWTFANNFFEKYADENIYRLDLNCGYCKATPENYDALVECGYEKAVRESDLKEYKFIYIVDNHIKLYTTTHDGKQFYLQDGEPTWIKPEPFYNNDWTITVNKDVKPKYRVSAYLVYEVDDISKPFNADDIFKLISKQTETTVFNPSFRVQAEENTKYTPYTPYIPTNVAEDIYNEVEKTEKYRIVKDFTNTYCIASELHYEKYPYKATIENLKDGYILHNETLPYNIRTRPTNINKQIEYNEQINEWVYVEEEDKNVCTSNSNDNFNDSGSSNVDMAELKEHFAKFGFEVPDFEAELKFIDNDNFIIGTIDGYVAIWDSNGIVDEAYHRTEYNLTPLKKEWYGDEANFPALIKYEYKTIHCNYEKQLFIANDYTEFKDCILDNPYSRNVRLATEAELLSLHYDKEEQ